MRADARANYDRLLSVAREVVTAHGADASLRDVARKADVGLGTLYRHFPTREALIEALLRTDVDSLTAQASVLETSSTPENALLTWLRGCVALNHEYRGVTALFTAALETPIPHSTTRAWRYTTSERGFSNGRRAPGQRGPTSTAPTCSPWSRHSRGSTTSHLSRPAPVISST